MFEELDDLKLTDFFFDNSLLAQDFHNLKIHFFDSGKKVRGSLVMLTGDILSLDLNRLKTMARVAEMVHNSTLVHDDVIDLSATRRDQATVNQLLGNKKAVLTGDYLLSRSLYELTQEQKPSLVSDMAETLRDLVEGEWIQMTPPKLKEVTLDFLINISDKKTSSLLRWCILSPLRMIDAPGPSIEAAKKLAYHLGVGYQMTDDVLDFSQDSKKTFSLDLINGLPNYVILEAYQQNPNIEPLLAQASVEQSLSEELNQALQSAIPEVSKRACEHLDQSLKLVDQTFQSTHTTIKDESLQLLKAFITSIKNRNT